MKLNLGSGEHPLEGFVNLDLPEWDWRDGFSYPKDSVDAITVSHSLYLLPERFWTFTFTELARVLIPSGILRITEDATDDPASERFGGFAGWVTLTSALKTEGYMQGRFTAIVHCKPDETLYSDRSLIQRWHGEPPKVFHIEGRKI